MKSVVASLLLFFLMLLAVVGNFYYVNGTADRLLSLIDALPDAPDEASLTAAEELQAFWREHTNSIGFSVGYTVLDRVSEQAVALVTAAEYRDFFGYRNAIALLRDAVGDLRRLERFSWGNLL